MCNSHRGLSISSVTDLGESGRDRASSNCNQMLDRSSDISSVTDQGESERYTSAREDADGPYPQLGPSSLAARELTALHEESGESLAESQVPSPARASTRNSVLSASTGMQNKRLSGFL